MSCVLRHASGIPPAGSPTLWCTSTFPVGYGYNTVQSTSTSTSYHHIYSHGLQVRKYSTVLSSCTIHRRPIGFLWHRLIQYPTCPAPTPPLPFEARPPLTFVLSCFRTSIVFPTLMIAPRKRRLSSNFLAPPLACPMVSQHPRPAHPPSRCRIVELMGSNAVSPPRGEAG
jgi:hypothetical protein